MRDRDVIDIGVALLDRFEDESVSLATTLDRLDAITTDHRLHRQILEQAAAEGIIEINRDAGIVRPQTGTFLRFQSDIVTKEGSFSCARCGRSLTTGYFISVEHDEIGPFGSSCIRKVTGRD